MTDKIQQYLEHTQLKPVADQLAIETLVDEAIEHHLFGVCVPPYWVKKVKRDIQDKPIALVTVIGFPFGYQRTETKETEIQQALKDGADELDLVMNLTAFKTDPKSWAKTEIARFSKLIHQHEAIIKVIIETAYLNKEEIKTACQICVDAGVDIVKTSTGYAPEGAKVEDIAFMREILPDSVGIKASGGIRTLEKALAMIGAGADRIGTSAGAAIATAFEANKNASVQ